MNDFTASNGIPVTCVSQSGAEVLTTYEPDHTYPFTNARGHDVQALREFFRAEADERLGRWRWPENQDYVVYHDTTEKGRPTDGTVVVLHEPSGDRGWCDPGGLAHAINGGTATHISAAALAYFSAHPRREPKPWHDAKPGDVWRFETPDDRRHALGWVARDGSWDLMTPRGENVREVADPMVWLVGAWGDEFEGAKATRFVPEVSS